MPDYLLPSGKSNPAFVFPSGKTMAEMEKYHEQWELDHLEEDATVTSLGERRRRQRGPIWTEGRQECTDEQVAAYAARLAGESSTAVCAVCQEPLAEAVTDPAWVTLVAKDRPQ